MRRPRPWYWKSRNAWFVQVNGKQIKLGPAETRTKNPPEEVMREYHRLMAGEHPLTDRERAQVTVPLVVDEFIDSKAATRPKTIETYLYYLEPFALRFKNRRLDAVRVNDVLRYVADQESWGDSTKHNAIVSYKSLFKWARDVGYLASNPLAGLANPYPVGRRERGITLDEFGAMIDATPDEEFKAVLRFLRDTGCRPGDLCKLSARHLHPKLPVAILEPREHKTGSRTGKKKTIFLPGSINDELRGLAQDRSHGPLLLNTYGKPWNPDAIQKRVYRLREKLELPSDVVPYAARHSFLTRLIEMGIPLAIAAKIAGHSRVDTIQDVYLHPETQTMVEAVQKAAELISSGSSGA